MTAAHHVFLPGVRAVTEVQYAAITAAGERFQHLHLPQSALDGSCGLLCVLQAAMVLTGIPRRQVEGIAASSRSPLRQLWQLARELYFDGTFERELAAFVDCFSPELSSETIVSRMPRRIGSAVATAIDTGQVPIVCFDTRSWSHWAMVIGYEQVAGETSPRALLMLDPSGAQPWGCFYNARLDLQARARSSVRAKPPFSLSYRYTTGEAWGAALRSVVLVRRAQPP